MLQLRKFSTQLLIDFHFFGINLPVVCGDLRHPFGTASDLGRPHKKGKSTNTSGSNMSGTINEKNILFMLLFFFFWDIREATKIHSCLEHHLENIILSTTQRVVSIRLTHRLFFRWQVYKKSFDHLHIWSNYWSLTANVRNRGAQLCFLLQTWLVGTSWLAGSGDYISETGMWMWF